MNNLIYFNNSLQQNEDVQVVQINEIIGQGSFGTVYKAIDPKTQMSYAVKMFKIHEINGVDSLMDISVCCTIQCIGLCSAKDVTIDADKVYILMELADCDIFHYLHRRNQIIRDIRKWMFQLLYAMFTLNHAGTIHGDIKSNNILYFSQTDEVKLCDFSLALRMDWVKLYNSVVGSGNYRAPEAWINPHTESRDWDYRVDIWSLGCIFYEFIYRRALFVYQAQNQEKFLEERERMQNCFVDWCEFSGQYCPLRKNQVNYFTSEFPLQVKDKTNQQWNFLKRMLQFNPHARATWEELLVDPYLTGCDITQQYQIRSTLQNQISSYELEIIQRELDLTVSNAIIRKFILELYSRLILMPNISPDQKIAVCYFIAFKIITGVTIGIRNFSSQIITHLEREVLKFLSFRIHFSYNIGD